VNHLIRYATLGIAGIWLAAMLAAGCNFSSNGTQAPGADHEVPLKPLVIKAGPRNAYADIRLSIRTTSETDSATTYSLLSGYGDKPVGLLLMIPKAESKKSSGKAWFKSLGKPSDLLLRVLDSLYHQPSDTAARFVPALSFVCMNLKEFFSKVDSSGKPYTIAAEYKLFFNSESEQGDAELYMNINPEEQWVELAEKDRDYRSKLIGLFKQH
jgi:hypothetical protein